MKTCTDSNLSTTDLQHPCVYFPVKTVTNRWTVSAASDKSPHLLCARKVSYKKKHLTPAQTVQFLGMKFDSHSLQAFLLKDSGLDYEDSQ